MKYIDENLEIHLWNWLNYDTEIVLNFLKFVLENNNILKIKIKWIKINSISDINEDIYENDREEVILDNFDFKKNSILNIFVKSKFIESIVFYWENNLKAFFYINYSNDQIHYSYEFPIEDLKTKEIFNNITELYKNLIIIFNPIISNWWFWILRNNINEVKDSNYFEWIFWYISNDYLNTSEIIWDNIFKLNSWILFYIDENINNDFIFKYLK